MTRNIRALGLALATVFAMSALLAASAQAVPTFTGYETTTGNPHVHTTISGTTDPGTVERSLTIKGTTECHTKYSTTDLTGDASTLTVTVLEVKTPNTEGTHCNLNTPGIGNFKTDIDFMSCDYLYHVETKLEADTYTGSVDVKCATPGDGIHIRVTNGIGGNKCQTIIPEQTGLKHIIFHNKKETKPTKVTVTFATEKTQFVQTEGGILGCGQANGVHEGFNIGEATFEGSNTAGEPVDLEVSGE